MSLRLPDLDDRTYADLVQEARALIPSLYPEWTNHNATDPGITLIELFAWLTEMLIYRVDRLPREHMRTFLRLLNGPDWVVSSDLDEDIRLTVGDLRRRHRAVTAEDYEVLAQEASKGVARVRCVPLRDLTGETEEERDTPRPGQVSVIVVPDPRVAGALNPASQPGAPLPSASLLASVADSLEPRRLITVRHFVVGPIYVPIQAEIILARRQDVPEDLVKERVLAALESFLEPLTGGPDGGGWPFGRDVYVSEIYQLLESVPGVDYVPEVRLSSVCPPGAPRCVAGQELWHEDGNLIGLGLGAHHLPWAQIDPGDLVLSAAFLPFRVRAEVTRHSKFSVEAARRAVEGAIRLQLHPRHGGPDGKSVRDVYPKDLRPAIESLPEVAFVGRLEVAGPEDRVFIQDGEKGIRFLMGELADVTVAAEASRGTA